MRYDDEGLEVPFEATIYVEDMAQLRAVYALLGSTSPIDLAVGRAVSPVPAMKPAATEQVPVGAESVAVLETAPAADGTVDAAGWPWSPELHASTKTLTQAGLWRMKIGVTRPDPKPGFPKADGATGTPATGTASPSGAAATAPTASTEDDDEFAAFRDAAAKSNASDAKAAGAVPARKWTDADLGTLCNQAAVKMNSPDPVRAIIAEFIPEGVVSHSRNIPAEHREAFAKKVEEKFGIEFAG